MADQKSVPELKPSTVRTKNIARRLAKTHVYRPRNSTVLLWEAGMLSRGSIHGYPGKSLYHPPGKITRISSRALNHMSFIVVSRCFFE
jgi:hypothetical protein